MKGAALTDVHQMNALFRENEVPYLQYSMELISSGKIPIIKRRSLYFQNKGFANALEAIRYIQDKELYDVGLIKEHLVRISRLPENRDMMDLGRLYHFYKTHARIFIYGAGTYASGTVFSGTWDGIGQAFWSAMRWRNRLPALRLARRN